MTDEELIKLLADANQKWHVCDHWDTLHTLAEEVRRLRGLVSEIVDLADRDTTSIWELRDSIAGVLRSMRREVRK